MTATVPDSAGKGASAGKAASSGRRAPFSGTGNEGTVVVVVVAGGGGGGKHAVTTNAANTAPASAMDERTLDRMVAPLPNPSCQQSDGNSGEVVAEGASRVPVGSVGAERRPPP